MRGIVEPDAECGLKFGFRLVNGMAFWWLGQSRIQEGKFFSCWSYLSPARGHVEMVRVFLVR